MAVKIAIAITCGVPGMCLIAMGIIGLHNSWLDYQVYKSISAGGQGT
jgi:hypothetical protein